MTICQKLNRLRAHSELTITNNVEYNAWKEKIIEKKRKEEATFETLDEFSNKYEIEVMNKSASMSTAETSLKQGTSPLASQKVSIANEGSLSFIGSTPKFALQNPPPSKNTTFEMPYTSSQSMFKFLYINLQSFVL